MPKVKSLTVLAARALHPLCWGLGTGSEDGQGPDISRSPGLEVGPGRTQYRHEVGVGRTTRGWGPARAG